LSFADFVVVDFNDFALVEELEKVLLGEDGTLDIFTDQSSRNHESFGEEVNGTATICEADKGNFAFMPGQGLAVEDKR